jgi:hypothetical protein
MAHPEEDCFRFSTTACSYVRIDTDDDVGC